MPQTATRPAAPAPAVQAADLGPRVAELVDVHCRMWHETDPSTPDLGPGIARRRRAANGRASRRLIDEIALEVERCPPDGPSRAAWRRRLRERLRLFGERRLGWPAGYRRLLIGDAFFDTSTAFVRQARRFDPGITWEDIGQALRNVWIVNSLQMLLDSPVELSPAVFAYSMLYPYTDNLLDDPGVEGVAKVEFNRGLDRRLRGAPEPASSNRQRDVWRLIESIEAQYPRPTHPGVFGALLAIQAGQARSLEQQESTALGTEDLLALSLEKGGASVLVDGYLVRGFASAAEEEFFFGYGVFLQLLDDLQDARCDAAAGHRTLFSDALAHGPLDALTARLHCLMGRVLKDSATFGGPEFSERRDLIHRNCTFLLVSAVAENPELFSRRFRRGLQGSWPLQFRAMRRLRRQAAERFRAAAEVVRRRQGSDLDPLFEDAAQSFSGTST